jgi:apolipoprotein N-acyltransferase
VDPLPATAESEAPSTKTAARGPATVATEQAKTAASILPLTNVQAAAAAVACGVFYFFAFPGLDLWPFGFVALVPLRIALVGRTPKAAAWLGWLSGMTMVSIGFYWMFNMMRAFSGFSAPLCVFFVGVVNAFVAGRIALFAWLFVRSERNGWPAGPGFLAAFVASELCFPVLFFWSFGAVVHPVPLLTQVADLGGVYAVGLIVVAFNWALAEFLIAKLRGQKPDLRRLAPYAAAPLVAVLYGAVRIAQVDARVAEAPKARVGLVQANMGLMEKRQSHQEGLRRHLTQTQKLRAEGPVDLVLWSESSVMRSLWADRAAEVLPEYFTRQLGVPTIFGAVLYDKVKDARCSPTVRARSSGVTTSRSSSRSASACRSAKSSRCSSKFHPIRATFARATR